MMGNENQTALWNGLRAGDEKSLRALYSLYYSDLLRYGLYLTNDAETSKEQINLLFLGFWTNRQKLPEVNNPKAYSITSFKNRILFRKKRAGGLAVAYPDIKANGAANIQSCEETFIEMQQYELLKQKLDAVLKNLTERQRLVITLRFIEEQTYEQIAAQLDVCVRTVYNSIHESLKSLRVQVRKTDFAMRFLVACFVLAHTMR